MRLLCTALGRQVNEVSSSVPASNQPTHPLSLNRMSYLGWSHTSWKAWPPSSLLPPSPPPSLHTETCSSSCINSSTRHMPCNYMTLYMNAHVYTLYMYNHAYNNSHTYTLDECKHCGELPNVSKMLNWKSHKTVHTAADTEKSCESFNYRLAHSALQLYIQKSS